MDKPGKLGDILKNLIKKETGGGRTLEAVQLARRSLRNFLGPETSHFAQVTGFRGGMVEIVVESPALFQEIRGFRKKELLEAFRKDGLKVRGFKVKVGKN